MFDRFGRPFETLRISVTSACNFSCYFCHREGAPTLARDRLGPEDLGIIAEAARRLGARSFKLTGGEPLVRRDIADIVGKISRYGRPEDLSMTTNASRLAELASRLRRAGLRRVNISLHSLRRETFRRITGRDMLDRVLEGVDAAVEAGLRPLKINFVIMRGVNSDELWNMVDFAAEKKAILQVIELHPVGEGKAIFPQYHYPAAKVEEELAKRAVEIRRRYELHMRPIYVMDNGALVEVVGPVGNYYFCSRCTRIRIMSDGRVSPCLNWQGENLNLLDALRSAEDRERKVEAVAQVLRKANLLRRPTYLWPVKGDGRFKTLPEPRPWSNMFRLEEGLPIWRRSAPGSQKPRRHKVGGDCR